jgi:hypothetical protein
MAAMDGSVRIRSLSHLTPVFVFVIVIAPALGCGAGGASVGSSSMGSSASSASLVDGAHLMASLVIPTGMTVTIPEGAKIVADPMVTITVQGVLNVESTAGAHAQIAATVPTPAEGKTWGGLVVDTGGDLEAQGLDLVGAELALEVRGGAKAARYDSGTISSSPMPFQIDKGGRLDTSHATVASAMGPSGVSGELDGSYLDYEKSGYTDGIVMGDASAVFDMTDSTFHGPIGASGDFIVTNAAAFVHVAYSTIDDAHCAFHFGSVTQFQIDHVTAGAASPTGPGGLTVWGAMLYGSGAGPNTISNSNFMAVYENLDQQFDNGPLTITSTYTSGGTNTAMPTWTWLPADIATTPTLDAKPR